MSKRFSAVFVRFYNDDPKARVYMFEAPYYNRIEVGDMVTVENEGKLEAQVVAIEDLDLEYSTDRKQFELLQKVTGAELPLKKVLSVIKETKIEYEEDKEDGENE